MNPFAVKLSEYITEDGRTVARIVRESSVALRVSTFHAYKDGRRLPVNVAIVDTLVAALGLTVAKRDHLVRCYKRALELTRDARMVPTQPAGVQGA
jgi:hypothetical protein